MEKDKKIKVLMILPNLKVANGVTSYAMNYFRKLDVNRIGIDFVVYDGKEKESFEKEIEGRNSKLFVLPSVFSIREHKKACEQILRENHYDIVHDNSLINTIPMMLYSRKFAPVRILHSHNSKMGETRLKELRNRIFLPVLKATATDYVACSQKAGKAMFGRKSYTMIPNVINAEKYKFSLEKREEIRKKMGVEDKLVVGTVGRVAPQKNPFFAFSVMKEVVKKCPKAEYWWIGSGPLEEKIKEQIQQENLTERIKLYGNREDVEELYQAMDCFFLPSVFEGLPVTGLEAQAYGLPCVVSDSITRELEYTNLVEYVSLQEDIGSWAEIIMEKLESRPIKRDYRDELLQSCFSDINAGLYLEKIYAQLMKSKRNIKEEG